MLGMAVYIRLFNFHKLYWYLFSLFFCPGGVRSTTQTKGRC